MHSVGVQRQYTGTAGRIENSQVGMFLDYVSRDGHTLIDRRVYVPASWTDDRKRCQAAGMPDTIGFATKSELAADLITAALDPASRQHGRPRTRHTATAVSSAPTCGNTDWVMCRPCPAATLVPLDGGKTRVRADRR